MAIHSRDKLVDKNPFAPASQRRGANRGAIYLVYANNNSGDGADIVFQKSTDQGISFSAPIEINASPGQDSAQWFPWVTVDNLTGRVHVFYDDQGIDKTGDLKSDVFGPALSCNARNLQCEKEWVS